MSIRNYRLLKELGKGAFGTVVLVSHAVTGVQYCVKKVDVRQMSASEQRHAAMESRILNKFDHPNIVKYKEQFVEGGMLYIVMEGAEDGDLDKRLRKQRGRLLPEALILQWFVQICRALQHVHAQNVLHRDIKAQNVFLTDGGKTIKVGDFGISKVLMSTNAMARTKVGTPFYLSPEICRGKQYDKASDIWSLGVLLYELTASGKHPFTATSLPALTLKITRGKYPPPPANYSSGLRRLIADMLSLNPAKRPDITQVLARASHHHLCPSTERSSSGEPRMTTPPLPKVPKSSPVVQANTPETRQPNTTDTTSASAAAAGQPRSLVPVIKPKTPERPPAAPPTKPTAMQCYRAPPPSPAAACATPGKKPCSAGATYGKRETPLAGGPGPGVHRRPASNGKDGGIAQRHPIPRGCYIDPNRLLYRGAKYGGRVPRRADGCLAEHRSNRRQASTPGDKLKQNAKENRQKRGGGADAQAAFLWRLQMVGGRR